MLLNPGSYMLRYTCVVIVDAKLQQLRYLWRDIEISLGPR